MYKNHPHGYFPLLDCYLPLRQGDFHKINFLRCEFYHVQRPVSNTNVSFPLIFCCLRARLLDLWMYAEREVLEGGLLIRGGEVAFARICPQCVNRPKPNNMYGHMQSRDLLCYQL